MKRVCFDLDGTLTEWKEAATIQELKADEYFFKLAEQPDILEYARKLAKSEDVEAYIVSAFLTDCPALRDKGRWCDQKIPEIENRIFVKCGTNKASAVKLALNVGSLTDDDILVDDHTPNLIEWEEAGGKAIKWLNGINGNGNTFKGPRTGDVEVLNELIGA